MYALVTSCIDISPLINTADHVAQLAAFIGPINGTWKTQDLFQPVWGGAVMSYQISLRQLKSGWSSALFVSPETALRSHLWEWQRKGARSPQESTFARRRFLFALIIPSRRASSRLRPTPSESRRATPAQLTSKVLHFLPCFRQLSQITAAPKRCNCLTFVAVG